MEGGCFSKWALDKATPLWRKHTGWGEGGETKTLLGCAAEKAKQQQKRHSTLRVSPVPAGLHRAGRGHDPGPEFGGCSWNPNLGDAPRARIWGMLPGPKFGGCSRGSNLGDAPGARIWGMLPGTRVSVTIPRTQISEMLPRTRISVTVPGTRIWGTLPGTRISVVLSDTRISAMLPGNPNLRDAL